MRGIALLLVAVPIVLLGATGEMERAWQLAADGHREEAMQVARDFIGKHPEDGSARLFLGSLLAEAGQQNDAIAELSKGAALQPNSAEAQNALGEAYSKFGNLSEARIHFQSAVHLNPKYAVGRLNLGQVLVSTGAMDEGAAQLDQAMELLPAGDDLANAHYLRAKVYAFHDDATKAAEQLQVAVTMFPQFPEAWSDLGAARKALLDDAGALAAFEQAVRLAPDDAVAQYRLGVEYLNQHQTRAAVDHLSVAFHLNPGDQSILNGLQKALRQNGQVADADAIKSKLVELLKQQDGARQRAVAAAEINNAGASQEKSGDLRAAIAKYREALSLDPQNVSVRVNYAVALLRSGQWDAGLKELQDAQSKEPNNSAIQEALKEALAQSPRNRSAH